MITFGVVADPITFVLGIIHTSVVIGLIVEVITSHG